MKNITLFFSLLVLVFFTSCTKPDVVPDQDLVEKAGIVRKVIAFSNDLYPVKIKVFKSNVIIFEEEIENINLKIENMTLYSPTREYSISELSQWETDDVVENSSSLKKRKSAVISFVKKN